ncbi:MAG: 30S ribosomal protein S21 [bacterium]|nr:30S ribosomal protein S21 [bacterium]
MVVVTKKKGDSNENMFRKFTRLYIDGKVVDEVRERMFYKRPSQVRKEEEKERRKKRHTRG